MASCASPCFYQEIAIPCTWHISSTDSNNPNCFLWWEAFNDPILTELIEEAQYRNSDVRLASLESCEKALESVNDIAAEVARNYFELRGSQEQLAIIKRSIEIQDQLISLNQGLLHEGFIDQIGLIEFQSPLNSLILQRNALTLSIKKATFQLSTLLSYAPDTLSESLNVSQALPKLPCEMPIGTPCELIEHHPAVQVARKLYQKTCSEQAFYNYQKQSLANLKAVETALAEFTIYQDNVQHLYNTQNLRAEAYHIIQNLTQGPKDERDLLQAHQAFLKASEKSIQAQVALLISYVNVYAALSVGWECNY